MSAVQGVVLVAYFGGLAVLAFFALHRAWLVWRAHVLPALPAAAEDRAFRPAVTVQLPLYNERFVARRLLDAVACLDWPRDRLDVQVIDDSTDETTEVAAEGVARMRAAGIDAVHIRRERREGFKAGALADGLRIAPGEFVLVLDADFVPQPDLLHRLLPPFQDPTVGMVQARWGHINRDASALTRTEALFLDAHFLLETTVRAQAGVFFNFHGTAGVWRCAAIERSGGWSADTLTEDLDLSYRAQMAGWRFVFLPDVVVPAELPETLAAFRRQQARWTQGAAGTAAKLLGRLFREDHPSRVRFEAVMHLGAHVVYPVTLLVALLAVPALFARESLPASWLWIDAALALAIIVPTRIFYGVAARRAGLTGPGAWWTARLLVTAAALAVSSTRAAWAGWRRRPAAFERTPKTRGHTTLTGSYRPSPAPVLRLLDGGVAAYLVIGTALTITQVGIGAAPFLALMAVGFAGAALRG